MTLTHGTVAQRLTEATNAPASTLDVGGASADGRDTSKHAGILHVMIGTTFSLALATRPERHKFAHLVLDYDSMVTRVGLDRAAYRHLTQPHDYARITANKAAHPGMFYARYDPIVTAAGTGGAAADAAAIAAARVGEITSALNAAITTALSAATFDRPADGDRRDLRVILTATLAGGSATGLLYQTLLTLRSLCREHGIRLQIEVHTTLPETTGDLEDRGIYRRIAQASATLVLASTLQGAAAGTTLHFASRCLGVPTPLVDLWYLHSRDGGAGGHLTVEELTRQVMDMAMISADRDRGLGRRLEQDRPRYIQSLAQASDLQFQPVLDQSSDKMQMGAGRCLNHFSAAGAAIAWKGAPLLAATAAARDTDIWLRRAQVWGDVLPRTDPRGVLTQAFGAAAEDMERWARALREEAVAELVEYDPAGQLLGTDRQRRDAVAWYEQQHGLALKRMTREGTALLARIRSQIEETYLNLAPIPTVAAEQAVSIHRFLEDLEAWAMRYSVPPTDRGSALRAAAQQMERATGSVDQLCAARDTYIALVAAQFRTETRAAWWRHTLSEIRRWKDQASLRHQGLQRFVIALQDPDPALSAREATGAALAAAYEAVTGRCVFTLEECRALADAAPRLAEVTADGIPRDLIPSQAARLLDALALDTVAQAAAARGDLTTYLRQVYRHRMVIHLAYFGAQSVVELLSLLYPEQGRRRHILSQRLQVLAQRAQPTISLSDAQLAGTDDPPLSELYVELPGGEFGDEELLAAVRTEFGTATLVAGPAGADERIVVWIAWHGIALPMLTVFGGSYARALLRRLGDGKEAPVWFSPEAEQLALHSGLLPAFTPYDQL